MWLLRASPESARTSKHALIMRPLLFLWGHSTPLSRHVTTNTCSFIECLSGPFQSNGGTLMTSWGSRKHTAPHRHRHEGPTKEQYVITCAEMAHISYRYVSTAPCNHEGPRDKHGVKLIKLEEKWQLFLQSRVDRKLPGAPISQCGVNTKVTVNQLQENWEPQEVHVGPYILLGRLLLLARVWKHTGVGFAVQWSCCTMNARLLT